MGRIGNRPCWVRNLSILLRGVHQVGGAVFVAAYLVDALPDPPMAYVLLALVSGILLFGAEWWRHPQAFRETSGVVTLVKILLLGGVYHGFLPVKATVLLAYVLACLSAHAPKQVRHRLIY